MDLKIFEKYKTSSTNFSQYDPTSIMHYGFPAELTLNGVGTLRNPTLSATDKEYIARWYPYQAADVGKLRTNDDCDEIDFQVEHGVEDASKVRFVLTRGSNVTWVKLIDIPTGANGFARLQINRGLLDPPIAADRIPDQLIDVATLDSSRPIRFHKAKFLGIHTLLDYRWDVISALPGGSKVTLNWVKERCR